MKEEEPTILDREKTTYVFIEPESIFDQRDFKAMRWDPTITPYRQNILEEIEEWLKKLEWEGLERELGENEHAAYYIQMVDNHLEIGFANIKFIR